MNKNKRNNNNRKRLRKKINNNRRRIRGIKRRFNNQMRRMNRRVRGMQRRIPAAYTGDRNGRYFRIIQSDSTSITVTGKDLVYKTPDITLESGKTNVLTIIPANPAYWSGTRVASIALGYQQFRPLKFQVHYVPTVSTMRSGSLFAGTLWNSVPSENNLEQTLTGSQGSINTQLFKPASAVIKLGRNLNTNLYNIHGELDTDSNPFIYVAIAKGDFPVDQRSNPGLFYVTYTFTFKNPIGNNSVFSTPGMVDFKDIEYKNNTTAYLCKSKVYYVNNKGYTLPVFTELQLDWSDQGAIVASYNGEYVPLEDNDKLWVFQNWSIESLLTDEQPLRYSLKFDNLVTANVTGQGATVIYRVPKFNFAVFFGKPGVLQTDVGDVVVVVYNFSANEFLIVEDFIQPISGKLYVAHGTYASQQYLQFDETFHVQKTLLYYDSQNSQYVAMYPNTRKNRYRINDHDVFQEEEEESQVRSQYDPLVYWEMNGNKLQPRKYFED